MSARFDGARAGDLQIKPQARAGATIWITDRVGEIRVSRDSVSLAASSVAADSVRLGDRDLEGRIAAIRDTPGVGESNVTTEHVAPGSVGTDKIGGVIDGSAGGTGVAALGAGLVVAAPGGGMETVPSVTVKPSDGGLHVNATLQLAGGGAFHPEAGLKIDDFQYISLYDLALGAAPVVSEISLGADQPATVQWRATDRDGDLRRVMVKYSSGQVHTSQEVRDAPDDWFEVDEGGVYQVFVGSGDSSSPYYTFYRDKAGTMPQLRGGGEPMVLHAGRSYRFERTIDAVNHPFWVRAAEDFDVTGSGDHQSGITYSSTAADDGFIQIDIPRDWNGTLSYCCTAHDDNMSRDFDIRPASAAFDREPVADLSGAFDAAGHVGTTAYVVAEDAAGNLSDAVAVAV